MALRDQPYIPLYVNDFVADERLAECSASATGIYIRLMCLMHKSDPYGTVSLRDSDKVLLKQLPKQNFKQNKNFASNEILIFARKLSRVFPYNEDEIALGLSELIANNVVQFDGVTISQKRMVQDNRISILRSEAGRKGGNSSVSVRNFAQANAQAKSQAKYRYENENSLDGVEKGGVGEKGGGKIPSAEMVEDYFVANGYPAELGRKAFDYYEAGGWTDGRGNKVKNWKQKMQSVWFRDENKKKSGGNIQFPR